MQVIHEYFIVSHFLFQHEINICKTKATKKKIVCVFVGVFFLCEIFVNMHHPTIPFLSYPSLSSHSYVIFSFHIFNHIFINIYSSASQPVFSIIILQLGLSTLPVQFCLQEKLINCHLWHVGQPLLLHFHCLHVLHCKIT